MSTDEHTAAKLVKTLENGSEGFSSAAEKLDHRADVAARFRELSAERRSMADELRSIASVYGDDMPDGGSVPGAMHRGWLAFKDLVTGSSDDAVISAAATGEEHAVEEYQDALQDDDVSADFRTMLSQQLARVESARSYVKSLT